MYKLKGYFTHKFYFCHHLLTHVSFQTCMSFVLMLNIKEDILKNAGNQTLMVPIDIHSVFSPTMEVNGDKRLGYVCNPRSLKEGTETSRRRTDDLGSRLERPIHFECKLNEPMHIGMRLLHPAAADHSVSISRQQVQRIFRFSLRSRAGERPLSGGTGAVATGRDVTETFPISRSLSTSRRRTDDLGSLPKGHGYCPFQSPVEASCAPIFLA